MALNKVVFIRRGGPQGNQRLQELTLTPNSVLIVNGDGNLSQFEPTSAISLLTMTSTGLVAVDAASNDGSVIGVIGGEVDFGNLNNFRYYESRGRNDVSGEVTVDFDYGMEIMRVVGATTITAVNMLAGKRIRLILKNETVGSVTVTLDTNMKWTTANLPLIMEAGMVAIVELDATGNAAADIVGSYRTTPAIG